MKQLQQYIMEVLGVEIQNEVINKTELGMFPLYLNETYRLYNARMFNHEFILAENRNPEEFSILHTEKHFKLIKDAFNKIVVLFSQEMSSLNRKRLIEKGINFIVPKKQLFLPDLLIDLREGFRKDKYAAKKEVLMPSAQFIVLYRILHHRDKPRIEDMSFKELAKKLNYTPMAITYAAETLMFHEICTIVGEKEKYLRFNLDTYEMWGDLVNRKLLATPVIKKVFVDKIDGDPHLPYSNASALPEYTNMNPSRQQYLAIEKKAFYALKNIGALHNMNEVEGSLCLEVWKYNPKVLVGKLPNDLPVVDPLSLYLSLKDSMDERTEMALEQLIDSIQW